MSAQVRPYIKSYSHSGEDLLISQFLDLDRQGSYLDVGSGRAIRGSNSYFFYKRGWSGFLIDPIPRNIKECKRRRPKDTSILALASNEIGEREFYEFSPYELSSYDPISRERAIQAGGILRKTRWIPSMTVSSLNIEINPADNFFLSVDVEGSEMLVLAGINWEMFKPRLICVEDWNYLGNSSETMISQLLTGKGYERVAHVGLSSLFHYV